MKKAVQLYSVRLLCQENYEKALQAISEYGYEGVEFAGFYDIPAQTMKEWLDKYNLVPAGSHTGIDLLKNDLDNVIAYNKAIGNTRIVCPGVEMENTEDVLAAAQDFKEISKKLKENGMKLYYHNHAHEFKKDGDDYLLDILANSVSKEDLSLEIDCYWVFRGGEQPVGYMQQYIDRMDIFHLKDGTMENGTAVGSGEVDIKGVLEFTNSNSLEWLIVEAEAGQSVEEQLEQVKDSIDFVNKLNIV